MKAELIFYLSLTPRAAVLTILAAGLWLAPPVARAQGQNLFVTDGYQNIYKITPSGTVTVFATNLDEPNCLAFDNAGNLYEADQGANKVNKFTPAGMETTFATGLHSPVGLAFDTASNLYVANSTSVFTNSSLEYIITKITPAGTATTFAASASSLSEPYGLAFDSAGNLYAANNLNNTISKISPAGTVTPFASGLNAPAGLAFDTASNLYVANVFGNSISKVTPAGMVTTFASDLDEPNGVAFNSAGKLFDGEDTVINEFTPPSGTPTAFATLPSGSAPYFLAFQPASAAPLLSISHASNQVIISWPASATGYTLQTNNNLATTNWGDYTGVIINNAVTNAPSHAILFYRLR